MVVDRYGLNGRCRKAETMMTGDGARLPRDTITAISEVSVRRT
jgi:hypothetical protein